MKSLSSEVRSVLMKYYRLQSEEVKSNVRRGLGGSSFVDTQLTDNQSVTPLQKENP